MRLRSAALFLALSAPAGCAPYALPAAPTPQPAASTPASPPPAAVPPPRTSIPPPAVSVRDQCGAAELQMLVGRPRSEIPVPLDPNRQRVACTTCPVTLDYNPARLNIFYDAQTGLIREVRCG